MFFFVIALEIVSITSEGNDQKCVLQLHSKEDKYFIINYTGHGVTTQEILSPMVITNKINANFNIILFINFVRSYDKRAII